MDRLFGSRMATLLCLAFAMVVHSYGPPGGFGGYGGYGPPGYGSGSGSDGSGGNNGFGFGGSGNGNNGFPSGSFLGFDVERASYYRGIHGIICSLAMVVLFPLGAILMRIIPGRFAVWTHALFQMVALLVYIAGAGLGIYLVTYIAIPFGGGSLLTNEATKYHPIIGIITLVSLLIQPLLGYIHHNRFKRFGRRQVWSYLHIFNGRIGITIGIINGGLGLNLAAASASEKRIYIIVAAVMWSLWMLVAIAAEILRLRRNRREANAPPARAVPAPMVGAKNVPRRSDSHSDRRISRSTSGSRGSRNRAPRV
ncbi:hypothetical protein QBC47DRAFT_363913 [Echria macrotheca]|uniref:Cytochrome b561 domain-containing protein n=1 Tax=Echria macrotheca TaxID=438768 RepID=A0AAJ0F2H2_9PEZI|nr:hypothetical protein QBC47DRAFT_363913 [Echria macrotheca]